ncbi:MAG TPA: SRPBCC family protein [Actinomycetota bacterium]|nr:SRPBCC family protein [Actinomycetota bacterium]
MGRAVDIETNVALAAPPEAVWPYLVDWERLGLWMEEASNFRVITSQREGVGVEARATVRIGGITTVDTIRVSRWEPPEWLEIQHMGWVKGSGLMHCRPTVGGSYLWWRERLLPPWGWIGWLGVRVLRPLMRRTFQRDLALLKELVEGERPR